MIPPTVAFDDLIPSTELAAATRIDTSLRDLSSLCDDFKTTLALFDFSSSGATENSEARRSAIERLGVQGAWTAHVEHLGSIRILSAWRHIAARDAAVTLWDFRQTVHSINRQRLRCPTINSLLDTYTLDKAARRTTKELPDAKTMRDMASHQRELKVGRNSRKGAFEIEGLIDNGSDAPIIVACAIVGRSVHWTANEKTLQFEMSETTLTTLEEIRDEIYASVRPATEHLSKIRLQKARSGD